MKIIVGLGNPGKQYENTRHNAGFLAVDFLAGKLNVSWKNNKKFQAEIAEADGLILMKPQTFMNDSGGPVRKLLSYYKLLPKRLGVLDKAGADLGEILVVVHDDLDIGLGKYKNSTDSRSAGHRGVQSIIDHLKTKKFRRVRIGINSAEREKMPSEKFVLQKFSDTEQKTVKNVIKDIFSDTGFLI